MLLIPTGLSWKLPLLLFFILQRIFLTTFNGQRAVLKERFSKRYRHPKVDEVLTRRRTRAVRVCSSWDAFTNYVMFLPTAFQHCMCCVIEVL